ncbi:MAG: hypothetical protein A2857_02400 [Candidatus Levybacteria bacterium RIFCSPHIGHO2_01_FULL_36_15]|nr:MAG: hypothetical protein A2857_02400 [Candidatus Levybacteria bacterium RIFCSPHIGHO2_01_FULL_36_15]OGH39251.1 MAG: hypothetical protein A2905_01750 [Candidatus Levybacteria bacterium RIFCSPLOWO2_01_FULL_36_10]
MKLTKVALMLLLGTVVLLIASVILLFIKSPLKKEPVVIAPTTAPKTPAQKETPSPAPLTQQNANDVLSQIDSEIQSSLDQANQDLNSIDQLDTTADSESL